MEDNSIEKEAMIRKDDLGRDSGSFRTMLQFATGTDLLIFCIGMIGTTIFSISPILVVVKAGDVIQVMEEHYGDLSEFYEAERELAIINFVLGAIAVIMGWLGVICFVKIGNRQGIFWKKAYFNSTVSQSVSWFDKNNPAEMGTTIDVECNIIEHALGEKSMLIISALIFFLGSWILAFIISIELALVSLLQLPVHYASTYMIEAASSKAISQRQSRYKVAGGIAEESLEGVKTVASCNAQEERSRRYQAELEPLRESTAFMGIVNGFGWGIFFGGLFVYTGAICVIGAYLMENEYESWTGDRIDARIVFVVCFATGMASFYLSNALPCLEYIQSGRIAATKIDKILKESQKYDGERKPIDIEGSIVFEKVYFNYESNPDVIVLRGICFEVQPGDSLAIVGETGSGKSTIIQLIEGFYYCSSGAVRIDGVDIKEYDISAIRDFISLVSQEPILFNCSIEENIKLGTKNSTDSDVVAAAEAAEANEFIEHLPDAYKTWVGVKGSLLSGGQKQRIALARAMIKKPKILLLDEATSALDTHTENLIQLTIEKIMQKTTTVIVAHRLSTIKSAKQIAVLDKGVIVEYGTYEELLSLDGHFKRLLHIQVEADPQKSREKSSHPTRRSYAGTVSSESGIEKIAVEVFSRVLTLMRAYWGWLFLAILSALLAGSAIPAFSYLLADNTNILLGFDGDDLLEDTRSNLYLLSIIAVAILIEITIMCASLARIAGELTYDLRYQSLNSLLFYDQKFYDQPSSSPSLLSYRLETDCEKVSALGGPILGLQVLVFTSMVGGITISLLHDVVLALVITAFMPLIIFSAAKGELLAASGITNNNLKQTTVIASDTFTNIKTVHSLNQQGYFFDKYIQSTVSDTDNVMASAHVNGFAFGSRYFMIFALWGVVAWYGAYRVKEGDLAIEDMLITFYCILFTYLGFILMGALAPDVKGGIKGGKKLFRIIDYEPEINSKSEEGHLSPIEGSVEFCEVDFRYEGRNVAVLNCLSFSVNSGGTLGITGTTGSGKSTIAQLLLRFYDPTGGEILVDSNPISSYNIKHLRNSICWVGQEPILFRGSIFYNLQLAMPEITKEKAEQVLVQAQAQDIIEKYGIDSDVGLRGNRLSGGQKQRISIARALVRKPAVLILDEATSALDADTEANLIQSITTIRGLTIIAIAHRLQSIRYYQKILLIEKGMVLESGTHDQLMQMEFGFYKELYMKSR